MPGADGTPTLGRNGSSQGVTRCLAGRSVEHDTGLDELAGLNTTHHSSMLIIDCRILGGEHVGIQKASKKAAGSR